MGYITVKIFSGFVAVIAWYYKARVECSCDNIIGHKNISTELWIPLCAHKQPTSYIQQGSRYKAFSLDDISYNIVVKRDSIGVVNTHTNWRELEEDIVSKGYVIRSLNVGAPSPTIVEGAINDTARSSFGAFESNGGGMKILLRAVVHFDVAEEERSDSVKELVLSINLFNI